MEPDTDALVLLELLAGKTPDPIHACDVMILTAVERGSVALAVLRGEVLTLKIVLNYGKGANTVFEAGKGEMEQRISISQTC